MERWRLWVNRPRRSDTSLLSQFYFADLELHSVIQKLDALDGRKEAARSQLLVQQLRFWQEIIISFIFKMMAEAIPSHRASRDYRMKFPDDLVHDGFTGQVWFAAECLSAGSNIANHERQSEQIRPLAKTFVANMLSLRMCLKEQCFVNRFAYSNKAEEALMTFDRIYSAFEYAYVSAVIKLKTASEFEHLQDTVVLMSEGLGAAMADGLIEQSTIEECDPSLMFAIPRLAIVHGLLSCPDYVLMPRDEDGTEHTSDLFRVFRPLLQKMLDIIPELTDSELRRLREMLASTADTGYYPDTCSQFLATHQQNVQLRWKQKKHRRRRRRTKDGSEQAGASKPDSEQKTEDAAVTAEDASTSSFSAPADMTDSCHSNVSERVEENTIDVPLLSSDRFSAASTVTEDMDWNEPQCSLSSIEAVKQHTVPPPSILTEESQSITIQTQDGVMTKSTTNDESETVVSDRSGASEIGTVHSVSISDDVFQENPATAPITESHSVEAEILVTSSGDAVAVVSVSEASGVSQTSPSDTTEAISEERSISSITVDLDGAAISGGVESLSETTTGKLEADDASMETDDFSGTTSLVKHRGRFQNTDDMLHRLFVCIAGISDQLQTNCAAEMRYVLRMVFNIHSTEEPASVSLVEDLPPQLQQALRRNVMEPGLNLPEDPVSLNTPPWVPDEAALRCNCCFLEFTFIRRRHHCRNCGQIFCSTCSAHAIPLPARGLNTSVRVCDPCFREYCSNLARGPVAS